ncbi:hypothetical protein TrLO_g10297 [Triparma laevis f. longispina]|uniref:PIH1D1/2/3 CS-like domain-containing protein n=1 Tax=Triparma laevis f. longispina TaxID=1714387 RepID=A0A9W7KXT5_9STRA|nr:hypothetical protein TrLO_g10297 [Triparma laevis f. longispina]
MSGLVDSLNYSKKFDFVDSDDEDYVEKVVMKKALTSKSNSISVRNQAAHALAKKGKLDGPSAVDRTIQKTRTKMEEQLAELKAQMDHIDSQQNKLGTIDNPDDALKFMESSGLKPEDIQKMVEQSGFGDDKSGEINKTVDKVAEVSDKISSLRVGEEEELDSDDEDEVEAGAPPPTEDKVVEKESKKKALNEFEKAFQNNQAANSFAKKEKAAVAAATSSVKKDYIKAQFSEDYTDATFSIVIELPNVKSMKNVDLQVSSIELKLTAATEGNGDDIKMDYKFKNEIDDESIKAKFSKKNARLTISGLLD